jgi:hypothetical protein
MKWPEKPRRKKKDIFNLFANLIQEVSGKT